MSFNVIQNKTGYVNPSVAIVDTGWTISGAFAIHVSCNSGIIKNTVDFGVVVGKQYTITYTVDQYVSGGVNVLFGTTTGITRTAAGTYTETLTCLGNNTISFFSDGSLRISVLQFYDTVNGAVPGITISFNEKENKWSQQINYDAEVFIKFIDSLLTIKSGELWLHNSNPTRGNFYGIQYPASVKFIINDEYLKNKLWYNLRLDSVGKWFVSDITIEPNDQFPNGMKTVMTPSNLKSIDGKLWGDILRDITDPNFNTITDPNERAATALFNGRMMQGGYLIVTLQCNDSTPASLTSAEFYYTEVNKSL